MLKINEDKEFLCLQRQPGRPGCILGVDIKSYGIERRRAEREDRTRKVQVADQYGNFIEENEMRHYQVVLKNVFVGTICFFRERDASLSSGSEDVDIVEEIEMVSKTDSTMLERSPIPATSTAKRTRRLPMEFLQTDPGLWKDDVNCKMGQEILSKLQVVNDTAEREVKVMEEFN
ncbi:hypothetical protein QE152_g35270 [Popillia japonica]|uniref:Uncharacterized protein n=1 Tax=Popillia japonica TaxID=7064 RepID=A0AAW1IG32_POPJA